MRKLSFMAVLVSLTVIAGCSKSDEKIQCGDYQISYAIVGDDLNATINGDAVQLKQAVAASGARYVGALNDTELVLWNKGADWMLILNDGDPIECK
ncbi:MAG: MliC family protein [Rickettsiales bacterium]|jgi:membrane-bound inhibitor of C-type lysozyme|nr:MliC family protein [Rickettsiales bacterium]